jgi:Domain of unknown function (DUF4129)
MDSRTVPARRPSPLGRWLPPLGAAALLTAAVVAAALSSTEVTRVPLPRPRESGQAGGRTPSAVPPSDSVSASSSRIPLMIHVPDWVTKAIGLVCLAVILTIVAMMIWYVIRDTIQVRRAVRPADAGTPGRLGVRPDEVIAAVDAGLTDLADLDGDARSAVIACWVRLEEAAAAAGTPREIGDTSTDLVLRLLHAHRVSRPVLDRFAAVYRQARYGTGPVDERMRVTAVTALTQLRTELSAVDPVPVAPVQAGPPRIEGPGIRPAHPELGR